MTQPDDPTALPDAAPVPEPTKDQLYEQAQALDVPGRSSMNKEELAQAIQTAQGAYGVSADHPTATADGAGQQAEAQARRDAEAQATREEEAVVAERSAAAQQAQETYDGSSAGEAEDA